jgi:hypothetical protein
MHLWQMIKIYLDYRFPENRTVRWINHTVFWSLPPALVYIFYIKLSNPAFVAIIGVLWAVGLVIWLSSQYVYDNEINIERISVVLPHFVVLISAL